MTQSCSCSGGFVEGAAPAIPWSSSVLGAFVPLLVPAVQHVHYEVSPLNLVADATGVAQVFAWHDLYFALLSQLLCVGV